MKKLILKTGLFFFIAGLCFSAVNDFTRNNGMYEWTTVGNSQSVSQIDGGVLRIGNKATLSHEKKYVNQVLGSGYRGRTYNYDNFTFGYTAVSGNFDLTVKITKIPERDTNHEGGLNQNPHFAVLLRNSLSVDAEAVGQAFMLLPPGSTNTNSVYTYPVWRLIEGVAINHPTRDDYSPEVLEYIPELDDGESMPTTTATVDASGPIYARIRRVDDDVTVYFLSNDNVTWRGETFEEVEWLEDLDENLYFGVGVANGIIDVAPYGTGYTGVRAEVDEVISTPPLTSGQPHGLPQISNFTTNASANGFLPFNVNAEGVFFGTGNSHLLKAVVTNESEGYGFECTDLVWVNHRKIRFNIPASEYYVTGNHKVILFTEWAESEPSISNIFLSLSNLPAVSNITFPDETYPVAAQSETPTIKIRYIIPMDTSKMPTIIISNESTTQQYVAQTLQPDLTDSTYGWDAQGLTFTAPLTLPTGLKGAYSIIVTTTDMIDANGRQLIVPYVAQKVLVIDSTEELQEKADFVPPLIKYTSSEFERSRLMINIEEDGSTLEVVIFDYRGREVKRLWEDSYGTKDAGVFSIQYDGKDNEGRILKPGSYFARVRITKSGGSKKENIAPLVVVY